MPRELLFNITIIDIDFFYYGGYKLEKFEVMVIKTMFVFRIRILLKDQVILPVLQKLPQMHFCLSLYHLGRYMGVIVPFYNV